ncbi:MAG TPA: hypothetical protein VH762_01570 [Gemmatimonadaceae bacterium]
MTPTSPAPSATLTVLTISHDSIGGGPGPGQPNGKVTLSAVAPTGGLPVTLSADNAAANVPQSVTVPAGATEATFQVITTSVSAPTSVRVTARAGTIALTDSLKVLPGVVSVVGAGWVSGSNETQRLFRITMSGPAPPGGLTVYGVVTDATQGMCHPAPAFIPATVPAGATEGMLTFTADKQVLREYHWEVIYGLRRLPQPMFLVMPARVGAINIPTTMAGGSTGYGTVQTLGGSTTTPACQAQFPTWYNHEYTVYFSSSNPALLQVPSSGLVSPGQSQLSFAITASPVTTQQSATITASRRANTGQLFVWKQVTVIVTP